MYEWLGGRMNGWIDGEWMNELTEGRLYGWADEYDGRMDGSTGGWMDRWIDGWMSG